MTISDKALTLILSHEGINQPYKHAGGDSGVTIGYGYDLGYNTEKNFRNDWEEFFSESQFNRLSQCIGIKGSQAATFCPLYKDIHISHDAAYYVLVETTIPKFELETVKAFGPAVRNLPLDAQGALLSLVYNRGGSMVDPVSKPLQRLEMRLIRDAVQVGDLQEIANQLRSMKRIWEGKGLNGLIKRREDEALLVESSINFDPKCEGIKT